MLGPRRRRGPSTAPGPPHLHCAVRERRIAGRARRDAGLRCCVTEPDPGQNGRNCTWSIEPVPSRQYSHAVGRGRCSRPRRLPFVPFPLAGPSEISGESVFCSFVECAATRQDCLCPHGPHSPSSDASPSPMPSLGLDRKHLLLRQEPPATGEASERGNQQSAVVVVHFPARPVRDLAFTAAALPRPPLCSVPCPSSAGGR